MPTFLTLTLNGDDIVLLGPARDTRDDAELDAALTPPDTRVRILEVPDVTPPTGLRLTLTVTIDAPGLTVTDAQQLLGDAWTITGESTPAPPPSPYEQARAATALLNAAGELEAPQSALQDLWEHLHAASRALRIQAYDTNQGDALAGWESANGHLQFGRYKPY